MLITLISTGYIYFIACHTTIRKFVILCFLSYNAGVYIAKKTITLIYLINEYYYYKKYYNKNQIKVCTSLYHFQSS